MSYVVNVATTNVAAGSAEWPGGKGKLVAAATSCGTGSEIKLQYLSMGGVWVDIDHSPLDSNGMVEFTAPQGRILAVLTPTTVGLEAWAHRVFTK